MFDRWYRGKAPGGVASFSFVLNFPLMGKIKQKRISPVEPGSCHAVPRFESLLEQGMSEPLVPERRLRHQFSNAKAPDDQARSSAASATRRNSCTTHRPNRLPLASVALPVEPLISMRRFAVGTRSGMELASICRRTHTPGSKYPLILLRSRSGTDGSPVELGLIASFTRGVQAVCSTK